MMDLLVVSAAEFEVRPLVATLRRRGIPAATFHVGIGALEAATHAAAVATAARGKHVVFVGTAGTFGEFSRPWLCTASHVAWMPTCERMGLGYGIPRGSIHQVTLPGPAKFALGLPEATVLCSPSISLDSSFHENVRAKLDPSRCVENLELYSCVRPVLSAASSFEVIIGITNAVGPDAHQQWKTWNEEAAEMTAAWIEGKS